MYLAIKVKNVKNNEAVRVYRINNSKDQSHFLKFMFVKVHSKGFLNELSKILLIKLRWLSVMAKLQTKNCRDDKYTIKAEELFVFLEYIWLNAELE